MGNYLGVNMKDQTYILSNAYFVSRTSSITDFVLAARSPTSDSGSIFAFYFLLNEDQSIININHINSLFDKNLCDNTYFIIEGEKFVVSDMVPQDSSSSSSPPSYRISLEEAN